MKRKESQRLLTRTWAVCALAMVCCILWGSAFPCVKIGYELFGIEGTDTASQLLFAGVRFFLAGVLVLLFGSLRDRSLLAPGRTDWGMVLKLGAVQTAVQYLFFYVGLANTSGVKSSIIVASNVFLSILLASVVFRMERLTAQKMIGCVIGFAGVVVVNISGGELGGGLKWNGEGFILLSAFSYALASVLLKRYTRRADPMLLNAWQSMSGGLILAAAGALTGGKLSGFTPQSALLLLYMALISAVAYTIWGILLKHNPVAKVTVFGFMNPVCGVLLSALLLGEKSQAFGAAGVAALVLVCTGILVVNREKSR